MLLNAGTGLAPGMMRRMLCSSTGRRCCTLTPSTWATTRLPHFEARFKMTGVKRKDMLSTVTTDEADKLEEALGKGSDGVFKIDAEDGSYAISLRRIVFVKRYARETRVG